MIHELKTWPKPFCQLQAGEKTFEFRMDDRAFAQGDCLILREWSPTAREYSGRELLYRCGWILRESFGTPYGYAVISLLPLDFEERVSLLQRRGSQ